MTRPSPAVVSDILRYFVEHPRTADSLEGIARWRLRQRRIDDSVVETEAALEWLVRQALVQRINPSVGPSLFRLGEKNPVDIARLLAEEPC